MPTTKHTFCRICEPNCPLLADLDDNGDIIKLRPDRDHPVSHGFACHKGLYYLDVHNDPDRVNYPLRRLNPRSEAEGRFERVTWEDAFADIGRRLRDIRDRHGVNAIATYYGNPIAFNSKAIVEAATLGAKIGTRSAFGAATQDLSNKAAALEAMFGSTQWVIPDFYKTRYLLCVGSNPKVSHWTLVSVHRPMHLLQDIIGRGGKVCFINPRHIESATPATGDVVQIRPDTDVYLIAALIHEIDRNDGFDREIVARYGKRVDELRAFVARYPADRVAGITGIDAAQIRTIAHDFMAAGAAATYSGTGINQGRQGTLVEWLLYMLSFVTGNLGREGGNYFAKGVCSISAGTPAEPVFFDTPLGPMRHIFGQLPGNLLADFIECDEEPVRALIVMSGNPLLSVGGEQRLRRAFPKLELVVSLDLFRNATGELADYILPSADWLEREDINHTGNGVQPIPYVQYSDAVVAPAGERRDDCWILARIERELGAPNYLDTGPDAYLQMIEGILAPAGLSIDTLRAMPHQTALLPQADRTSFYHDLVAWPDHKVDCCPPIFAGAIERCETIFQELACEDPALLKIISLRTHYMHNTNLANMPVLKREKHAINPLHMHPDDALARGLADGDVARIFNDNDCFETPITLDASLRPGVVAMSHGYGHSDAPGISRAHSAPGVNINRLLPTGPGSFEPLSNMSHMNGVPVTVERVG